MKKRKLLIIPDVHGRKFWEKPVEEYLPKVDKVIFLGDYVDPYPREGISGEESIEVLKKILELKKNNLEKVILLKGNHDYQYINDKAGRSDRYDYNNSGILKKLFGDNLDLFQFLYKDGKYLFSHAGVMKEWTEKYLNCSDINELLQDESKISNLWVVPIIRGGEEWFGSCIWNDVRNFENEFHGTFQIFGHTQLIQAYFGPNSGIEENFACLDCRKCFILDTEEQEFREI